MTMLLVEQNANMALKTRALRLCAGSRAYRAGRRMRQAGRERGRARVLPRTEGNGRARQEALEAHQALALSAGDRAQGLDHERSDHATDPPRWFRDGAGAVLASSHDARRQGGHAREGSRHLEGLHLGPLRGIGQGDRLGAHRARAASRASALPSCPTTTRSGCSAIWPCCVPPACRPASIRPIPRRRSNTSSTTATPNILFVEDEEQLDKALAVRERTPGLRKIIVFDMEGLRGFSDPQVMSLDELAALGRARAREHPQEWERRIALPQAGDVAIIVYTSGTTGPSKGAMLTHRNIIFQMGGFKRIGLPLAETDEALNFLPLCHVAERFGGCYNHIAAMHVVNFAEAPDTVPQNLREVAPHIFLAVPRVWEKLYSVITIQIKEGTRLGRARLQGGDRHRLQGQRLRDRGQAGAACSLRVARRIGDWLVLKNIRVLLGLNRIRWAITGAAPISPDLIAWYWAHRRQDVRGLRADRECRPRHRQLPGPSQDRHHRPDLAGHRAQALPAGRNPAARAAPLQGLPQQARQDGRGAARMAGCTRATSVSSTTRASCASPIA